MILNPLVLYLPLIMRTYMFQVIYLTILLFISARMHPISIWGFRDFCYDGTCYINPSDDIAIALGGQSLAVDWDTVESLLIHGPALGIGVDPTTTHAYTNSTAYGLRSQSVAGGDAGTYECGHLYYRMLQASLCSAFVHVPSKPNVKDIIIVRQALYAVQSCGAHMR